MANVSVNKGLLVGLGAVAGVSLLVLAYQLGRVSGSGSAPAPPARIERIAPRPQGEPLRIPAPAAPSIAERAETRPVSGPTPPTPEPVATPLAAAAQVSTPVESERSSAGTDPLRGAVGAYFDAIERIQAGSMRGEAESVAHEMAAALASGDTSSLDKMIQETETARARLAVITPPAPCATHHRESLGSLDDALNLLRSLKTAMESAEPVTQLAVIASRATALRARADLLQKEELALKERYGLKR